MHHPVKGHPAGCQLECQVLKEEPPCHHPDNCSLKRSHPGHPSSSFPRDLIIWWVKGCHLGHLPDRLPVKECRLGHLPSSCPVKGFHPGCLSDSRPVKGCHPGHLPPSEGTCSRLSARLLSRQVTPYWQPQIQVIHPLDLQGHAYLALGPPPPTLGRVLLLLIFIFRLSGIRPWGGGSCQNHHHSVLLSLFDNIHLSLTSLMWSSFPSSYLILSLT